jgi:hypothetical protein
VWWNKMWNMVLRALEKCLGVVRKDAFYKLGERSAMDELISLVEGIPETTPSESDPYARHNPSLRA